MARVALVLAGLVVITLGAASLGLADQSLPKGCEDFKAKTYRNSSGETLPYRLLEPESIVAGRRYPLVLFLHGAGERGDDNVRQLLHGVGEFAKPECRRKHPCFVVAPQCSSKRGWVEVNWHGLSHQMKKEPSVPLRLALELVDRLADELPVDRSRIYVTGMSMGGYGTWEAASRRPQFFAAAMPLCGGGDTAQAAKLAGLPIWAFHGKKDTVVPLSRTTTMVEAIRHSGGKPRMTLYPELNHDVWTPTYADPTVLDWLFAQKKQ